MYDYYGELFKNVNEDFIFHILFVSDLGHRSLYRNSRSCTFRENTWSKITFLLLLLYYHDWFINNKLFNRLGSHELRMTIVNNLINYLIDQHKVLSNAFFI